MKVFCETCRKCTECTVKEEKKQTTIKGKVVKHKVKNAFCKKCHSEVFVSSLRDDNLKGLEKAYNKI